MTFYSGGTLDMNGNSQMLTGLGGSNGTVTNSAASTTSILTLGMNNQTTGSALNIQNGNGTLGVSKIGTGGTVLGGNNTFTGPVAVYNGTLQLAERQQHRQLNGLGRGYRGQPLQLCDRLDRQSQPHADSNSTALTLNSSAAYGAGTAGSVGIGVDFNSIGTGLIKTSGTAVVAETSAAAATVGINLYTVSGMTAPNGTFTVLQAAGGGLGNSVQYAFGAFYNDTSYVYSTPPTITVTGTNGTAVNVVLSGVTNLASFQIPTALNWQGGFANGAWAASNGLTSGAASNWVNGVASAVVPGPTATVSFPNNSGAGVATMTLGANMSIAGLSITDTVTGDTFKLNPDGNSLTIGTGGITFGASGLAMPVGTINAPIVLGANQSWTSNSTTTNTFLVGGGISGTGNLVLASNASNAINGITINTGGLSSAIVNNAGTITNAGTGTATTTISSPIGVWNNSSLSTVTSLIQQSTTSPFVISGTVTVPIGGLTVASTPTGGVSSGAALLTLSGNVGGTGNLTISDNSTSPMTFGATGLINNAGQIIANGSGSGTVTISSGIGPNVTQINMTGTSPLTV